MRDEAKAADVMFVFGREDFGIQEKASDPFFLSCITIKWPSWFDCLEFRI